MKRWTKNHWIGLSMLVTSCIVVPDRYAYSSPPPQYNNPPPVQSQPAVQTQPAPPPVQQAPADSYYDDPSQPIADSDSSPDEVTVDEEPPIGPPPPIEVQYAPPPMLYDPPPPPPYEDWTWVGGYWIWGDGAWAWLHGRWMAPPAYGYHFFPPYYEHRYNGVVFVGGHWGPPGYSFRPPPPNERFAFRPARQGYHGASPVGPIGSFIPPPPGSRRGILVAAPVGTAPQVVVGAPPVVRPGMSIRHDGPGGTTVHIFAPQGVTHGGSAVNTHVSGQASIAGGLRPVVNRVPQGRPSVLTTPVGARPNTIPQFEQNRPAAVAPRPEGGAQQNLHPGYDPRNPGTQPRASGGPVQNGQPINAVQPRGETRPVGFGSPGRPVDERVAPTPVPQVRPVEPRPTPQQVERPTNQVSHPAELERVQHGPTPTQARPLQPVRRPPPPPVPHPAPRPPSPKRGR